LTNFFFLFLLLKTNKINTNNSKSIQLKLNLDNYLKHTPIPFSISDENKLIAIEQLADILLSDFSELSILRNIESQAIKSGAPIAFNLAIKLAISKSIVNQITKPLRVSVTFAMYKENNRILPASEHPNGENFLMVKLHQLTWLFKDQPLIDWELLAVDDGCPEESGKIAQEILSKNNAGEKVEVLFLADAIKNKLPIAKKLTSTNDSQKGGSIAYGMWHATQKQSNGDHVIVYTDADLSTHLGQTGLLLQPLRSDHYQVSIGSRREANSVVVKKGVRNTRGKLFIYLWKRILPEINYLVDTQCGFKAFKRQTVSNIIDDLIESKFAIDIELLLKTELLNLKSIAKVGIAWIDSEAESTTTDIQPYLTMLKSISLMYRTYTEPHNESESFSDFIDLLNEEQWDKLVENVPDEIADREPMEYEFFNDVKVSDFKNLLSD
jgi:hypothetical protein